MDYRAKNGLKFPEDQKEMFFMSVSLHQSMQHDYDDSFGAVRYTITERESLRIVSIPNGQDTVVIVMKGSFSSTIRKVLDAINHVKNQDNEKNKNMKPSKTKYPKQHLKKYLA